MLPATGMWRNAARWVTLAALLATMSCGAQPPAPLPSLTSAAPPPTAPPDHEMKLRDDVVVTGGVHGNEPSGAAALEPLSVAGFRTFGPCNPWGLAHNSRNLENGRDLNRAFARVGVPEVDAVKAFLESNRPGLLLDLHEDGKAAGAYLIQHGPDDDLGERVVAALGDEIAFDPAPSFKVIAGHDGVLKPGRIALAAVFMSKFYGLAFHAWKTYGVTTFVVEVPSRWSAEKKRNAHVRIVDTARRLFSE
jgi:hypothetical protein